jgi:hypothetical protein
MRNEKLPLPTYASATSDKDTILMQYYRSSNNPGIILLLNPITFALLPTNIYNVSVSKFAKFENGNTVIIKNNATYKHHVVIRCYSTVAAGSIAIDIINGTSSISSNAISTNNVTPNENVLLVIDIISNHKEADKLQLRLGGGTVPGGLNISINILSINWTIMEV